MANVAQLVADYAQQDSCMLEAEDLRPLALRAIKFYAGYTSVDALDVEPPEDPPAMDGDLEISLSEWAVIGPLFRLYSEREQAIQMEATGMMGVGAFGRSSGEIAADIKTTEDELPRKAFKFEIITI